MTLGNNRPNAVHADSRAGLPVMHLEIIAMDRNNNPCAKDFITEVTN